MESFCGSQPRSKEAFWSRVETFSVSFCAKFQIVPVVCPKKLQKALESRHIYLKLLSMLLIERDQTVDMLSSVLRASYGIQACCRVLSV